MAATFIEGAAPPPSALASLLARADVYAVALAGDATLTARGTGAFAGVAAPTAENGATYDAAGQALNVDGAGSDTRRFTLPATVSAVLAGREFMLAAQFMPGSASDSNVGAIFVACGGALTPANAWNSSGILYVRSQDALRLEAGRATLGILQLMTTPHIAPLTAAGDWHGVAWQLDGRLLRNSGNVWADGADTGTPSYKSDSPLRVNGAIPFCIGTENVIGLGARDFDERVRDVFVVAFNPDDPLTPAERAIIGAALV